MNFKILLIIFIFLTPCIVQAQATYTISGQLTTGAGKPVQLAVLLLQNAKDSSVIKSALTDSKGTYTLEATDISNSFLKIDATGFITEYIHVDAAQHQQTVNIKLKESSKTLSEVTITSRKPTVEYKVDRTVFNVENSVTATGGDAWDALKKTPGVMIMRNDVTIAGKNSAGIMINGRLQQLSGDDLAQLLRSIPADNLSKIEVITNPPARYDAEGNGGLINIITKRSMKAGVKGNVTATYNRNHYNAPTISTALNYKMEKLNIFCSARTGTWGWKYTAWANTYYPGQTWKQTVDQGSVNKYARVQAGAEYNLTKSATIGFEYAKGMSSMDNTENISATSFNGKEQIDSVIRTIGETHEINGGKHTIDVNYEWRIDSTGKKLNIDANYFTQKTDRKRDFGISSYLPDGATAGGSTNRMAANPAITIRSVNADIEWPLRFAKLSFGAKASAVDNSSNNVYLTKSGGDYITDTGKTNEFSYREDIQAVYITAQKKIGKYDIQLGLRGEHTQTKGYSSTLGQTNLNDYIKLFPSGYVQYSLSDNHSFSVSVARRINRPGYNSLNPFRFYYTPTSYKEGNPNLQPSFNTRTQLTYTYKSKYNFNIIYNQTSAYWDRIIQTDTIKGTSSITWQNLGSTKYISASVGFTLNPTRWWETVTEITGFYAYFKPYAGNTATNKTYAGLNVGMESENTFFINRKRTLAFELSGYYYAPKQKDYKRWEAMSCINMGIRWMLMNKNLVLALNGDDVMARAYWLQTNLANGTKEYSYDDERSVRLSITYKFGNKNVKARRDRNISEEIQRAN